MLGDLERTQKAVVLGAGAVGTVIAHQLAVSKDVECVLVADVDPAKVRSLKGRVRSSKIEGRTADASSAADMVRVFRGADMVVNATVPTFNLEVMRAALKVGAHYMDLSTGGPKEATDTPELAEQMAFGPAFRKAGLSAVLSMGVDPGASNIFARYLADRLDRVHEVLVRDGDNSTVEGYDFAPLFSPQTLIEECLLPPLVFRDGSFRRLEPLGETAVYDFPEPVGKLKTTYVDHEEVETLPVNIKGLRRCDFMYALGDRFVDTLKTLHALGLTAAKPVSVKGLKVAPRELLAALLPDPARLGPKVRGHSCVGVEVSGIKDGRKRREFMYTVASHEECYRRLGVTATAFQTGVPPAIAVEMMARGDITRRGAFTPEMLDPEPWPQELRAHGMPVEIRSL